MTTRQAAVIRDVLENHTPVSVSMRNHGYSPQTSKTPQKLTNTQAWREVMNNYLPDHKLFKKHEEALEATKWNDFTGEREEDHQTRLKAIDMAYRLKGRMVDNGGSIGQQVNIVLGQDGYVPPNNVQNIKPTKLRYHKEKPIETT